MNPIYAAPIAANLEPTNSAAIAYGSGDCLGDPIQIPVPGLIKSGDAGPVAFLQTLTLTDHEDKKIAMEVHFFTAEPACVDNAPFQPSDDELLTWCGAVSVAATDWIENNSDSCVAVKPALVLAAQVPNKVLWAQIVVRATPTYAFVDTIRGKVAGIVN